MVLRRGWSGLLSSTYLSAQLLSLLMVRPELDGDVDVLPSERWRKAPETCRGFEMLCVSLSVIGLDRLWIALQRDDLTDLTIGVRWPNASERPTACAKQHTTYSDATYNIHQ